MFSPEYKSLNISTFKWSHMKVQGKDYRTVWPGAHHSVDMIDQTKLPFEFVIHNCPTHKETREAIRTMIIRGAGAIGAAAGYAMAQAFAEAPGINFWRYAEEARGYIDSARPTAQNLFWATNRVFEAATIANRNNIAANIAMMEAQKIADEDSEWCHQIGIHGNSRIERKPNGASFNIGTHCNAGWLAFSNWGSALSPAYVAHREGKNITVYCDETRPRSQGARLTAWELQNEGVPHFIVPDNAVAYIMSKGVLDLFIVGADRIARNGDVANKIGTLEKAIVAARYHVPFYVAAPTSTFDLNCPTGEKIPIEQRTQEEVLFQTGPNRAGQIEEILVCNRGSPAINPAFDVTPAELITGIITPKGIIKPTEAEILGLFR